MKHLLAALNSKTDQLYDHASKTKKHQDILRFFHVLRCRYHRSVCLFIILDNFSTHLHLKVKNWAAANNVELVYTPTYASWLNRIELQFPMCSQVRL
ncbi:transposase [Paenibacillus segetis]|uniref:transposase n=1 Tax=Paenibacillus segetis TaxID=1325360 RepID=UPI001666FAC4|nr:transposase [Paenibacillus segetis]